MLVKVKSSKTSGVSSLIASLSHVKRLVPPRLEVEVVCDMLVLELLLIRSLAAAAADADMLKAAEVGCEGGLNLSTVVET